MKLLRILFVLLIAWTLGCCNPMLTTTSTSPNLTATTDFAVADPPNTDPQNLSGDSIQPINKLDFSEITPPAADENPFVKLAEEDLAIRLKINPDQIHFLKISDIDWQDITQGCTSTPGQKLTKGRLSGYQIWLEANGKNYAYHIGLDNTIFLCPD